MSKGSIVEEWRKRAFPKFAPGVTATLHAWLAPEKLEDTKTEIAHAAHA